jgi:Na+/melibiose symporter-like transporter
MSSSYDRNYMSVGGWMFIMLVAALPVVGWIMVLIWAFSGDNETRKNYFRAILVWILVVTSAVFVLASMGRLRDVEKKIQGWTHRT